MKILFPPLTEPIQLSDEYVTTVVIENKRHFYDIATNLYNQANKLEGCIVLSKSNKIIDVSKSVELITQFVPFESNKKTLVTKLHQKLKEIASEQYYPETVEIISTIQRYIFEITDACDSSLIVDEIDVAGIYKLANVRFSDEYDTLAELIYNYCINVINLEGNKLFVFVGLRNYIEDEEFDSLVKTLVDHKIQTLFIENYCYSCSELEKRTIIDKDLCVI